MNWALLALAFGVAAWLSPRLPELVPTHWDAFVVLGVCGGASFRLCMAVAALAGFVPVVYSYVVYRRLENSRR